jgi:ABC-type multidrug transport system fused ATPase/permease subunit
MYLNVSHGQRQLMCLARAILWKHVGKLVLLDEAMSSVDQHTKELMTEGD